MKKTAIIWRKSVYENDFRCNVCKAALFNADTMTVKDEVIIDEEKQSMFCPDCKNKVAHIQEIIVTRNIEGLQGNWDKYFSGGLKPGGDK